MSKLRKIIVIILEAEKVETEKQFFDCLNKDHIEDLQNKLNILYIKTISVEHCPEIKKKEQQKLSMLDIQRNEEYEVYFLIDKDYEIPTKLEKQNAIKKFILTNKNLKEKQILFKELMLPDGHTFEFLLCMAFPFSLMKKYSLKQLIKNYRKILVDNGPFKNTNDWKKGQIKKGFHNLDKIQNYSNSNVIENLLENFSNRPANKEYTVNEIWIGELFKLKK